MQAEWPLSDITCNGGDPQSSGNSVTLSLAAGDDVTCTFTSTKPNQPPVAVDDEYSTDEDQPLTAAAPGVLANDDDPNSDTLTAIQLSHPFHGTLLFEEDSTDHTALFQFKGARSAAVGEETMPDNSVYLPFIR